MSKVFKTILGVLAFLIAVAAVAVAVVIYIQGDHSKSSAKQLDEIVDYSFKTDDMTTDLKDGRFVRIRFQIVTDSKDAKEEIEKREFQVENLLIKELAVMSEKDFKSGLSDLEDTLKKKLNDIMQEGKIKDVYTIRKILQ